jgi:serine/threonine protein kinase
MGWRSCNILLDENENVKICDFGLGRILGPQAPAPFPLSAAPLSAAPT